MIGQIYNAEKKIQNLLDLKICKSRTLATSIVNLHQYEKYIEEYNSNKFREKLLEKIKR